MAWLVCTSCPVPHASNLHLLIYIIGKLLSPCSKRPVLRQCRLHLHAPPALPSLRNTTRQCAINTERITSARRLLSKFKLSSPTGTESHLCLLGRSPRPPRRNPRRLGARHLGPNTLLPHALPILLTRAYRRILALPSDRKPRSTPKHDSLHDSASSGPYYGTDVLFDPQFYSAGEGYGGEE